jgi:MFS family permease
VSYRRGWVALMLFSLALINYIDRVALSFAITPVAREFGLSTVGKGYLFSSFLWTYTLFLIPMGLLVDRFGAKRSAAVGITLWSAATIFTGMAGNFVSLLAGRLLMGAGEASSNPSGARVIREWIPADERGVLNACFNSGSYAGPAICALAAGPIITAFGWRGLFYAAGAVGFVWLFIWLAVFGPPEKVSWLSEKEREVILSRRSGTVAVAGAAPKSGLLGLLRGPTLWGLALTMGCNIYAQYLFLTWLPSYLEATKGLNLHSAGLFTALPYGVAAILCILVGMTSDRFLRRSGVGGGRRRYVIASTMALASIVLLAPVVDGLPMLVVLIALSLTGIASTTSQTFSLTNDLLSTPADIGVAMGFVVLGGNVFGLLAPVVTGYVIAWTGSYDWAFVIAGLLLICGAGSVLCLTRQPIGTPWGTKLAAAPSRATVPSRAA